MSPFRLIPAGLFGLCLHAPAPASGEGPARPAALLTPVRIDTTAVEACTLADINGDGRLDIVAGNHWYESPGWKKRKFRTLGGGIDAQKNGFLHSDFDVALDVDGDGRVDIVSGYNGTGGNAGIHWYRNPGASVTKEWVRTLVDGGDHHSGELWDIDGDGKARELLSGKVPTRWYEVGKAGGLVSHAVSPKDHNYGFGVGDLDGDGRPDIIRPDAWYQAPADPRGGGWREHCLALGFLEDGGAVFPHMGACGPTEHVQQILVYDVDKDGWNDIITGGAHTYGVFWYRQTRSGGDIRFTRNIIDRSWSQVHALALADIDGDGDLDLVTGKRWRAHGLGDPGGQEPPGVYWYELKRGPAPEWTRHVISFDAGIGVGMNVAVTDWDRDGDMDFVATSKAGGPWLFRNTRNPVSLAPPAPPRNLAANRTRAFAFAGGSMTLLLSAEDPSRPRLMVSGRRR